MHICFVGEGIHPPWIRGHQSLTRELISCLKGRATISLVTTRMPQGSQYTSQFSEFAKQIDNLIEVKSSRNLYLSYLRLSNACIRFAKENKVDIVHLTGIDAGVFVILKKLSKLSKFKIIRQYLLPPPEERAPTVFTLFLLYFIYSRFIDGFVTTSPIVKEWLSKKVNSKKVFFIPLPIDCEFFRPLENSRLISNESMRTILYMGSLSQKRFPLSVLQSIKILKDRGMNILLLIVGRYDSEYSKDWLKKIRKTTAELDLKDNVKIEIKALSEIEKLNLYNSVDAVIFPFERDIEVTDPPITLLEAMRCGRIVLAPKIHSIPWLIDHGVNGFLLDSLKAEEIAEKIEFGLNSPWNDISRCARDTIKKHFSKEEVTEDLFNLYQSFLK